MSSPRYDIFEMYAQEHNASILKASNDARLLRSLSARGKPEPQEPAIKGSRSKLVSILASLIYILRGQPA